MTIGEPRFPVNVIVSPWSRESIAPSLIIASSAYELEYCNTRTWPVANLARFYPFTLTEPTTFVKLFFVGGIASGNVDMGIYDEKGTRLVSAGSTVVAFTNSVQEFDITDTLIGPGRFYLAIAIDNTSITIYGSIGTGDTADLRMCGLREKTSGFPLPATVTFGPASNAGYLDMIAATTRSLI